MMMKIIIKTPDFACYEKNNNNERKLNVNIQILIEY